MARRGYVTAATLDGAVARWGRAIAPYRRRRRVGPLRDAALVIVDMQHAFVAQRGEAFLPAARAVLPRVIALRDAFRAGGRPVAFTRHGHRAGERLGSMARHWRWLIREGTRQADLIPEMAPRRGEPVFRKAQYSAFRGTRLEAWLRRRGVRRLVVAGVMTHLCVETTARDAFLREMDVVVPLDACASSDEALHAGSLRSIADGFGTVATVAAIAAALGRARSK